MKAVVACCRRPGRILLLGLALVALTGCGGGLRRVPVSGTVTLDGKPVSGGLLYFNPDAAKGNLARVSCTSPIRSGRYELQTTAITNSESGSGVPPGWYKVSFRVNIPGMPPVFPGQPAVNISPKYLDPDKTPLAVEVVDSPQPGAYDLKLSGK